MSRNSDLLFVVAILLSACTLTAPPPVTLAPPTPPLDAFTPTPPAKQTPNPFPDPMLMIIGEEEVIFDWTSDSCSQHKIPDLP